MIPLCGGPLAGSTGPGSPDGIGGQAEEEQFGTFQELLATLVEGAQSGEVAPPWTGIASLVPLIEAEAGATPKEAGAGLAPDAAGEATPTDATVALLLASLVGAAPLAEPTVRATAPDAPGMSDSPPMVVQPAGEGEAPPHEGGTTAEVLSTGRLEAVGLVGMESRRPAGPAADATAESPRPPEARPLGEHSAVVPAPAELRQASAGPPGAQAAPPSETAPAHAAPTPTFRSTLADPIQDAARAPEAHAASEPEPGDGSQHPRAGGRSDGPTPRPREAAIEPAGPRPGARRDEQAGGEDWPLPARDLGSAGRGRGADAALTAVGPSSASGESDGPLAGARGRWEPRTADPAAPASGAGSEAGGAGPLAFREGMPIGERFVREAVPVTLSAGSVGRVVEATRAAVSQGGVEVQVRLQPETLGDVRVTVRWEGGTLSARLDVGTLAARDALEGSLQTLRATLHAQGIPVERLDVGMRMDLNGGARERESGQRTAPAAPGLPDLPAPELEEASAAPSRSGRLDVRI